MPSIASHFVVAKLVSASLNLDDDFYRGNILPDLIDGNSHHKIKGSYYHIPDIDYVVNELDFNNNLNLGYLCHLLLDKFFLEEYIPNNIKCYKDVDLFLPENIYDDYTKINYRLIKYFDLDVGYLNEIMNDFSISLNEEKYQSNLRSINSLILGTPKYINFDSYVNFLKDISMTIINELTRVKKIN